MSFPVFPPPFPPSWKLIPRETQMLGLFATDRIVSHADLESVIARHRRNGPKGRPLKVHVHYLRAKLAPYGIRIVSVWGTGFRLTAESRAVLAPYFAAADAANSAATGEAGAAASAADAAA